MRPGFYFVGYAICLIICTAAIVGAQRMGLDLPGKSVSETVAVVLLGMSFIVAMVGVWRILWPRRLRKAANAMLVRAPRFQSEHTTRPSNIGMRG